MDSVYLFVLFLVLWTGKDVQSVAIVSKAALQTADQELASYQTESDSNLQPDSTIASATNLYPTAKYANLNGSLISSATYGSGVDYGALSSANYGVDSGYGIGSSYGLNFVSNYGPNYGTADRYGGSTYGLSRSSNPLSTYGLSGPNYATVASYGIRNVSPGYENYDTSPVDNSYNREAYPRNQPLYVPTPCSDLGAAVNASFCCSGTNGKIDDSGINKCCLVTGTSCSSAPDKCCNGQLCKLIGNPAAGVYSCADPGHVIPGQPLGQVGR